jgi:osmotically-inducible protein OsmY
VSEHLIAAPQSFAREGDQRLFMELRRRLWEYEPLRATHGQLDLDVTHGTVRLTGRVRTQAMKEIIGYICLRAEGVGVVRNDLVSDTEVVRGVADALLRDAELAPLCIRVDARDGVATLSGELPSAELEARALEVARTAPTAAEVVSELVVRHRQRPPTSPARPAAAPAGAEA